MTLQLLLAIWYFFKIFLSGLLTLLFCACLVKLPHLFFWTSPWVLLHKTSWKKLPFCSNRTNCFRKLVILRTHFIKPFYCTFKLLRSGTIKTYSVLSLLWPILLFIAFDSAVPSSSVLYSFMLLTTYYAVIAHLVTSS